MAQKQPENLPQKWPESIELPWRGVVAQWLERKTLIHEVVGSNPAVVTSSVLPKLGGWMTSASGIGQAKSLPTKVGLAPGEVPQSRLASKLPLYSPGVSAGEMRHRPVHVPVSLREAAGETSSCFMQSVI